MSARGTCPICKSDSDHLNNHVRMSNGDGHGIIGEYPVGWSRDKSGFDVDEERPTSSTPSTVDPIDEESDQEESAEQLEIVDDRADARSYECECGADLEYHADECPDCSEQPVWRGVA